MNDFGERLKAIVEPKGVTLNDTGRMVRIEGFAGSVQITDAQIRYHNERLGIPDAQAAQRHAWIEHLMVIVDERRTPRTHERTLARISGPRKGCQRHTV